MKRNSQRLIKIRKMPCVGCGKPAPNDACHSNFLEHGKGMGTKANDDYTIPMCRKCHMWFDHYQGMKRETSKQWFENKLKFVNECLAQENMEVF